jgi:hypothetical protein
LFTGPVIPNSVTINPQERTVAFTALSLASLLASTDATDLFVRTLPPFVNYQISQSVNDLTYIVVGAVTPGGCDFVPGDTIRIYSTKSFQEATISQIDPIGSPVVGEYKLTFSQALQQAAYPGQLVKFAPQSRHQRNVNLQTLVNGLFNAAGLPNPDYKVQPLGNSADFFASAIGTTGLLGNALSITSLPRAAGAADPTLQTQAVVGTTQGVFSQNGSPGGTWTQQVSGIPLQPVDWRPQGSGKYLLYGPRRVFTQVSSTSANLTVYGYDYGPNTFGSGSQRLVYSLGWVRVTAGAGSGIQFVITLRIYVEKTSDAINWTYAGPDLYAPAAFAAATNPLNVIASLGAELDCQGQTFYFTEPYVGTAGDDLLFRISQVFYPTSTVTTNVIPGVRGQLFMPSQGNLYVFSLDTYQGNIPTYYYYTTFFVFTLQATTGIAADFVPSSLKRNDGNAGYYALTSSVTNGTKLLTFTSPYLDFSTLTDPIQLLAPGPQNSGFASDIAVIKDPARPAGTPWPMVALLGGQVFWLDFSFSSVIEYADLEGISCGDALAQLASLVNAVYYVDGTGATFFRTRNVNSLKPVGVPANLDDAGCVGLKASPVWSNNYLYVEVTNGNDSTITGVAGNPAYKNKPQALAISNIFVRTISFAKSLATAAYNYFANPIDAIELEHIEDARSFVVGNTFTATVNGGTKTFQITEVSRSILSFVVRMSGIKL